MLDALRREGVARRSRVGHERAIRTQVDARSSRERRGHRRDGARRNVDRRAESRRPRCAPPPRAHGALDDRRCGDVARRACRSQTADWGVRRLLQLHAEGTRRAVGTGADCVFRTRRGRRAAARRGREASISISALLEDYWLRRKYHHTISAPLIYALQRSARRRRGGGARGALGAASPAITCAFAAGLERSSACRCCRRRTSGCGR